MTTLHEITIGGRASLDVVPRAGVTADLLPAGVRLRDEASGLDTFIPTRSRPIPGGKVLAETSLESFLHSPLAGRVSGGGGALNVSRGVAELTQDSPVGPWAFHLVLENTLTPVFRKIVQLDGIMAHGVGLGPLPVNLTIPYPPDRIIIKSPPVAGPVYSLADLAALEALYGHSEVVVDVSQSAPALAAASLTLGNGARHVVQPTGAMDATTTALALQPVHEVVVNFAELRGLAHAAGLPTDGPADESSPSAPAAAAHLLRQLRPRHMAGSLAAVATLGKAGCVVADWENAVISAVHLDLSDPVATPAGTGDAFLGAWIFHRAMQVTPADPVTAAVRATKTVAARLGVPGERCRIQVSRL
jgi:hypothetical protein